MICQKDAFLCAALGIEVSIAFSPGIEYDIQRAGNLKSMFFGGVGLFLATLQGTGKVLLQSLPFSRMADRIIAASRPIGGEQG